MASEYLQGLTLYNLPRHSVPVLCHPPNKQSVSCCTGRTSCVSVFAHCLLSCRWAPLKGAGSVLFAPSLQVFIYVDEIQSTSLSAQPVRTSTASLWEEALTGDSVKDPTEVQVDNIYWFPLIYQASRFTVVCQIGQAWLPTGEAILTTLADSFVVHVPGLAALSPSHVSRWGWLDWSS